MLRNNGCIRIQNEAAVMIANRDGVARDAIVRVQRNGFAEGVGNAIRCIVEIGDNPPGRTTRRYTRYRAW